MPAQNLAKIEVHVTKRRLHGALACYAVLAVLAAVFLTDDFLLAILIFFAALAGKSWIAFKKEL